MIQNEADKIIDRLKGACTFHKFGELTVWKEYTRFFMRYDYETMNKAIDLSIEEDSKNVPSISILAKNYRESKGTGKINIVKNAEYCPVCDDKGYVIMRKWVHNAFVDKKMSYDYGLYCPFCDMGKMFSYDGRQLKGVNRSPYYIECLTVYYGDDEIEAMKQKNIELRERREERAAIRNS